MNQRFVLASWKVRCALAALSGLVLACAFPRPGVAGLAWIAPGLLLFSAFGFSGSQAFLLGYVGGLARALVTFYWLLHIPFPAGAIAGWVALGLYLALYQAVWVWFCWRILPVKLDVTASSSGTANLLDQFLQVPLPRRILWAVVCAAAWVALEIAQGRFLSGFPWNFLGASQYEMLPIIQIASLTGVYGVSFLMVWFSVSLGCAVVKLLREPMRSKVWMGDMLLPVLTGAGVVFYGMLILSKSAESRPTVSAALIQPSIPQTLIWDPNENTNRFNQLLKLSREALQTKPDLLIWPEAAVPGFLMYEQHIHDEVMSLASEGRAWMIIGADDAAAREGTSGREADYFNSSFLISPDAEIKARYRKRRLVIFGEYVPLVKWLPFLRYATPIGEGFKAGDKPVAFVLDNPRINTSVLICFEDTFPHLAREYVEPDTDFLINLTNNGWFGESAAQWQHAANAVFRAIENRIPLVRCSNNGLSCWVDVEGRMHDVYFKNTHDIYGAGFKSVEIPTLRPGEKRAPTLYTLYGDWFGWSCVGLSTLALVTQRRRRNISPMLSNNEAETKA